MDLQSRDGRIACALQVPEAELSLAPAGPAGEAAVRGAHQTRAASAHPTLNTDSLYKE